VPKPKYVPKHRDAPAKHVRKRSARTVAIRNGAIMSGVAVAATGVAVSAGVLGDEVPHDSAAALTAASAVKPLTANELAAREQQASRSTGDRRAQADQIKQAVLSSSNGRAYTRTEDLSSADPKTLTQALMPQYGLLPSQFSCIDRIWTQESNWNVHADNPHSSAYGIPQALPGSKMASAGPDWHDSAETQIRWGLEYIKNRYGSACSAWAFKSSHGFY